MSPLVGVALGGLLMSAISLVGVVTLPLRAEHLDRILLPLVAFAAGSLLGGAFFHMLPGAIEQGLPAARAALWTMAGFTSFLALEQFLHWRHCQHASSRAGRPLTVLIVIGDALHNFLDGLGVGGAMLVDPKLGVAVWISVAAHEVPQEIGDFAALVHGGWTRRRALAMNLFSSLTFLAGGFVAYAASAAVDLAALVAFAAGNFVYIGASDLVPEVNRERSARGGFLHFTSFSLGLLSLWAIAAFFER